MKAVLVARVSTDDKGQTNDSQLLPLREIAARKGWPVTKEVVLEVSAWDDQTAREVREAALEPIRSGQAQVVMVYAWDRISREGPEAAYRFLRELEQHYGGHFFSLQEPFLSTATASPEMRELMIALVAWAAKWESQRKSDRVKAKVASKKEASAKLGQHARWGRGKMPTPGDIGRMRDLRSRGLTVRQVAKETGFGIGTVSRACSNTPPRSGAVFSPRRPSTTKGSFGTSSQNGLPFRRSPNTPEV